MTDSKRWLAALACAATLALLAACGGGGGGSGPVVLSLTRISVPTQRTGPLSPFGTTLGGDTLLLTGTGFVNGLTVVVGTQPAVVQQVTGSQVTAVSPPGPEGVADVTVTNPGGESVTLAGTFQYVAPPVILSVAALTGPTAGENRAPIAGGETMEVAGTGFAPGLRLSVRGIEVATTFVDEQHATFPAPAVQGDEVVDVSGVNPSGLSATLSRGLVYTQEFSLARASDVLTESRAEHLFRRAGFGAPPDRIQQAVRDGLGATVRGLLEFANDTAVERDALAMYGTNPPPAPNYNDRVNKQWWIHLLVKNPNPLQERLAFFLHDHFATSERAFSDDARWFLHRQIQLFRRFSVPSSQTLDDGSPGLGYDWRKLLVEVAKDRAMLEWLDGRVSVRNNPNENFARELWELFMLGEGNGYTETDIQQAARAFTGFFWYWSDAPGNPNRYLEVRYRPGRHDERDKTVFGVVGKFGYDSVSPFFETSTGGSQPWNGATDPAVETDTRDTDGGIVALTLRQRPVEASTFICRKLASFLLYDDPHDSVVDALAAQLRAPGPDQWNLKPIVERILLSKAMYSSAAIKGKIKSPVEFVTGFLRTTGIDLSATPATNASRIRVSLAEMGQLVLDPPDVAGWPSGAAWMGAQSMLERFNFLNLAVQELDDVAADIDPLLPPAGQRSPTELVDHLAQVLDVRLSGNARTRAIEYVTTELDGSGNVVAFPFDPTNPDHLRMKSRGLIWMIAQYHDGHQD